MFLEFVKAYVESFVRIDFLLGFVMVVVPAWYLYKRGYRMEKKTFLLFVAVMLVELVVMQFQPYGSVVTLLFVFMVTLSMLLYRLEKRGV